MEKFIFKIVVSANNTYIQAEKTGVDEWGVISTKRGFINVQPDKAPALLERLNKGESTAVLGQYNRQQGLYEVKVSHTALQSEEAAASTPAGELVTPQ